MAIAPHIDALWRVLSTKGRTKHVCSARLQFSGCHNGTYPPGMALSWTTIWNIRVDRREYASNYL